MTDSVKIRLDVSHLPLEDRRIVPIRMARENDQFGEIFNPGPRPIKDFSPLARTQIKFIVRTEKVWVDSEGWLDVARWIDADLNIPNATCGHNLEHGTSVFAAGLAAMWLLNIWLANNGLTRCVLDLITTDRVTLRGVTLTFLMLCETAEAARQLVEDIRVTAKILQPNTKFFDSTNETVKMPTECGTLVAYWKTVLDHCCFPDWAPNDKIKAANELIARLEAMLTGAFLRREGLDKLESWRNAYAEGLYARLFEKAIREPLRLNLRHNRPRPELRELLTPMEREALDWYLDGHELAQFPAVLASSFPAQTKSKLHTGLLNKLDVETNIPWADHARLRCFKLRDSLVYPGDYHPPRDRAGWCFCASNWPGILAKLQSTCHRTAERNDAAPIQPLTEHHSPGFVTSEATEGTGVSGVSGVSGMNRAPQSGHAVADALNLGIGQRRHQLL